ncbi:glycosyltransferase CAZy family GT34-like protein [Selaginella moellendorffii]|uniref:Glycosyltransferase CAZy family GT34-like protein n=1 Tax=Selaginella moellendorffii TaxID=88036 RepID=D8TAF0_SELML|nr:probable xyloglucan 6-xylosyltransferase 1 [Selaginella moellendorffii]EFJ06379.1 glycosyltransferase CAZy family GT34-like protein [Selaginella moellendorffii]|eukprot:XP_002992573.1 probable xyloglucan 6-xylosyltransferase 1 [Selaginella moellendorffii]
MASSVASPLFFKRICLRSPATRKAINKLKITVVCGVLTILMLRGSIGAGEFGTPQKDFHEIQRRVLRGLDHSSRAIRGDQSIIPSLPGVDHSRIASQSIEAKIEQHPYRLGPKISDWDEQRSKSIQSRPTKLLMVTGSQPNPCDNPTGDNFLLRSLKNKMDYARLHEIEVFYNTATMDDQLTGFWAKLPLLRRLMLARPEIEWLWWLDSDAVVTDIAFQIPLAKYAGHNLVLHGWASEVYVTGSWLGLNTGSFLIRNCQWSLDLLDAWAPMGPKGTVRIKAGEILSQNLRNRPVFEADDQSALVFLLRNNQQMWGERVFLENSYYLHGYWVALVDRYEEIMEKNQPGPGDERWPFVTHFVGCKPCGKDPAYPEEKCRVGMERALNFGDNQVLARYGLRHKHLGTTETINLDSS